MVSYKWLSWDKIMCACVCDITCITQVNTHALKLYNVLEIKNLVVKVFKTEFIQIYIFCGDLDYKLFARLKLKTTGLTRPTEKSTAEPWREINMKQQ